MNTLLNKKKYLICWDNEFIRYIVSGYSNEITIIPLSYSQTDSIFKKILKKACNVLGFKFIAYYLSIEKQVLREIKSIDDNSLLIIIGIEVDLFHKVLHSIIPGNTEKYLWLWNKIREDDVNFLESIKKYNYSISSFDKNDANKYNLIYKQQFYRYPSKTEFEYSIHSDFYFMGHNHGRRNVIDLLKSELNSEKFSTNFIVSENPFDFNVSYFKNIDYIYETRCVVDIPQKGQLGLTLRVLEALFFNKKLITTNVDICNYDFYNSANIFIWSVDNLLDLKRFLETPYQSISDEIVFKYSVDYFINNISQK